MRLRAPEPEDLELLYEMENDTSLWYVGNNLLPYSRYSLRNYIEQTENDLFSEKQARFVIELSNKKTVGMIDLVDYDPFDSRAEVCIGLLEKFKGNGIAEEALSILSEYAFDFLNIHQLYAYIPLKHEASRKLFMKNGFEESGILKEWKKDGEKFINISVFQKIKNT